MGKRNVEIDDTLRENVDGAIEETKELLERYLQDNPDTDELPCLHNDLDYGGSFHGIIDSSVPIYTKEIEDTWYLYSDRLEEAYENAGIGENPRENNGMVAIYCYLEQEVCKWYYDNAQDLFQDWEDRAGLEQEFKERGFDKTVRGFDGVTPGCSRCEATCINGTACHETGCENQGGAA